MRRLAALVLLASGLSLGGCGPIVSGVQIINADVALTAAHTAGAQKDAIYEYTAAKLYLQKAREEAGYSNFAASRRFADKALSYAVKARKKAEAVSDADQPVNLPAP